MTDPLPRRPRGDPELSMWGVVTLIVGFFGLLFLLLVFVL